MSDGPPEPERRSDQRRPQERPQAAAHSKILRGGRQHPRWEAKRSRKLPLCSERGRMGERLGPDASEGQSAALRDLGNL